MQEIKEQQYKHIADTVTSYMYSVRIESGKPVETMHSETCLAVTGYTTQEFIDDPYLWINMVIEEDRVLVQKQVNYIFSTQSPQSIEHRIKRKDGIVCWVDSTIFPRHDMEGNLISYNGFVRDITEHKQAKEDLIRSENKFRELFNNANDAIYLWELGADGMPGRCIEVNDIACRMSGYTKDELLTMTPKDIDAEEFVSKIPEIMNELLAKGHITFEMVHMTKDGRRIPVEISSHMYSLEGDKVILSISRDITERKKAEKELENIFNLSPDMICVCTPEGGFIKVNPSCERVLGYTTDEILKLGWANLVHPDDLEKTNKQVETQLKGNLTINFINRFRCRDGTYKILEWQATPSIDGIVYAVARDITERKKFEEELQKTHKLESIGVLAGGIAHDFNNLLAGILNNIYLSKMHIDRESKASENLESAEKAISRATNLTRQLLTFSSGGVPIKKTTSIVEIARESADFALRGSNVNCEYNVADDLWPVEVDEGQMNQVIHNLILNANQSMPAGGTIRISIENIKLATDTGLPLQEGRYVKVLVQDQGIGIEKEHLQKIFDPYFSTKEIGRGLGLSITYSIIKQHDGLLTVESEKGTGTTFTIYLPASEKQVEEKETVEDISVVGEGRILIMDDEEVIRDSVGEFLKNRGYEIECVIDGDKAIELYTKARKESRPFNAVILDLTIRGGMGGKETVRKLLEIDPEVKAIVSSGYSNDPALANCKEYGFRDVFNKGYHNPDDLCNILDKVIKE